MGWNQQLVIISSLHSFLTGIPLPNGFLAVGWRFVPKSWRSKSGWEITTISIHVKNGCLGYQVPHAGLITLHSSCIASRFHFLCLFDDQNPDFRSPCCGIFVFLRHRPVWNKKQTKKTRWWFQMFFIFTPTWGRWSNLTSIFFQMGWWTNHQLEKVLRSNRCCILAPAPQPVFIWWAPDPVRNWVN